MFPLLSNQHSLIEVFTSKLVIELLQVMGWLQARVAQFWQMFHTLKVLTIVKMKVCFDIINLVGNYMVVNELEIPYEE
jgi:hypothetical protein